MLDSNIWRYIVDLQRQGELINIAKMGRISLQISPAVVYEALRLKDVAVRDKIIRLMINPAFERLLPEAYSESVEVLDEIKSKRPEWLHPYPDTTYVRRIYRDWTKRTGGFWVRLAKRPDLEAGILAQSEPEILDAARKQVREARREMIAAGWQRNPSMDGTMAGFHRPRPGWNGTPVEAWRLESLIGLSYGFDRVGNAYRDWAGPFLRLDEGIMLSPEWTTFWLHEAETVKLPRQWLRWGHSFAQRFRKVTSGSPGDTQLFSYLIDTDIIVSADKALLEIVEECRKFSPIALPETHYVKGGRDGISEMLEHLTLAGGT